MTQGDKHTQQLVECQRALVRAFEGVGQNQQH